MRIQYVPVAVAALLLSGGHVLAAPGSVAPDIADPAALTMVNGEPPQTGEAAVHADAAMTSASPTAIAIGMLDQLDAGDYAGAEARFDAAMAAAVPSAKLQALWQSLPDQVGAPSGRGAPRVSVGNGLQVVEIPLHYEQGELLAQVAINTDGRIAGFFIKPAPPRQAAAPAADASYTEQSFQVGTGADTLPGTLAMPKAAGPAGGFPAVVLVHGSGPQDRDETIGPNRPFLDIARGLAGRGIAVLRYDKRTLARPQDFSAGDYTVDDETTDDAVQAVVAVRAAAGIDPSRVYVMGHSQGAMLAPRIARKATDAGAAVAGLVMLAAPARALLDILPEQNRYLLAADGDINPAEQDFLDDLVAKIARVRSDAAMSSHETPLGVPAAYWRHFDRIDPVADAVATRVPMLLLQGGRDFQVIDTDWQLWHRALDGHAGATLRHYPVLNHLGIAGTGPGGMAEYQQPGHVDAGLIADVAAWITPPPATD